MRSLNEIRSTEYVLEHARTSADHDASCPKVTSNMVDDFRTGNIKVEVDKVNELEWAELVDGFDDANIYQTWPYGAVRWGEKNLSHLTLRKGQEVLGIAQLRIVQPSRVRIGVAYLRWGPLCHRRGAELDPDVVINMARALHEEYACRRGLYLEILPNAFSGSVRAQIYQLAFAQFDQKIGISAEEYRTLVLDLSPSLDQIRKNLDKKWRNQLNAAERNDLKITGGDSSEDYRRFCKLYGQMWQRKKFRTTVDLEEFDRIQERLPETQRMQTLICEHEGQPVAGLVCSTMGGSAIYLLGATNDAGMRVKASYLQQWTMIRYLKDIGVRFYDLGGIDPVVNPGVHHFKSGLSGAEVSHISSFIACDNALSAALVKTFQALRSSLSRFQQRPGRTRAVQASR
jgi:hypothetical protein